MLFLYFFQMSIGLYIRDSYFFFQLFLFSNSPRPCPKKAATTRCRTWSNCRRCWRKCGNKKILYWRNAKKTRKFKKKSTQPWPTSKVREICLYYTCWWYSLCHFQYRQQSEKTCSYNFECFIYTNMNFYILILCGNTRTSRIKTNLFFRFY